MSYPNWDQIRGLLSIDSVAGVEVFALSASTIMEAYEALYTVEAGLAEVLHTWLTAHFYTIANREETSRTIAGGSTTWKPSNVGEGLRATRFGQQVLLLDPNNYFASLGTPVMAAYYVGGDDVP